MRLSVDLDDRGYAAYKVLSEARVRAVVSVDGVSLSCCMTADEEGGLAIVLQQDTDGSVIFNAERTEPLRKEVRGRVVIALEPFN